MNAGGPVRAAPQTAAFSVTPGPSRADRAWCAGPGWKVAKTTDIPYYMQDEQFEWDDDKAAENLRDHRVSFAQAAFAFTAPFPVHRINQPKPYATKQPTPP